MSEGRDVSRKEAGLMPTLSAVLWLLPTTTSLTQISRRSSC